MLREPNKGPKKPWTKKRVLRLVLPWLIAGGMVAYLLSKYSLAKISKEMAQGELWALPLCAMAVAIVGLMTVSLADWLLLRSVTERSLRLFDVMRGKAATAVLLLLGYGYAGGAYALWISRHTGSDLRTTLGALAAVGLSDLTAVAVLVTVTLPLGGEHLPEALYNVMSYLAPALLIVLVGLALLGPRVLHRFVKDPRFFRPWSRVQARHYLANLASRVTNVGFLMVGTWLAARSFGVEIPFSAAMVFLPAIIFVGAMPVNVFGFGAVQSMWLVFEPWAPGERILAFQVLWHLTVVLAFVVRGLPFIRRVTSEVADGRPIPGDAGDAEDAGGAGDVESASETPEAV